jgi:hypothetical protein
MDSANSTESNEFPDLNYLQGLEDRRRVKENRKSQMGNGRYYLGNSDRMKVTALTFRVTAIERTNFKKPKQTQTL